MEARFPMWKTAEITIPVAWDAEAFQKVYAACCAAGGRVGVIPADLWWSSLVAAAYHTGSRIGALLAVRWSDVNLKHGAMLLRSTKSRVEELHQLPEYVVRKLHAMLWPQRQCVWEHPYHREWLLWRAFRRVLRRADRCGRLVGNHSCSAVAYDWTIHASYATCEDCASGSSSSSSDGSSEPGEHDYVVEDCQTGTKSRIFVPVIAEVGQVIRWRVGIEGVPRCGVVKPSGTTPDETFYFGVDPLGLYSDCNSCLN